MPAHDEEAFLGPTVREVTAGLRGRGRDFEVLVVENGSRDGTAALARDLAGEFPELRILSSPQADYGAALRQGLLTAEGEFVVIFDVDYFDLGFLDRALARMGESDQPAIVVGSKRAPGANDIRPWPRRLVTSGFSMVLRYGFGLRVSDTHGMKLLRRRVVTELAESCRFRTDLFDTELVLRTERAGLRAVEIPVDVEERRPSRSSIASRIPRTLTGLARLRLALWRERL
jgi:glycosyltransferase involved in cell wall biosynthesis